MRILPSALPAALTPGPDEAREWAERELAKPVYTEAEPTPIDRMARAVMDFLAWLFGGGAGPGWDGWLAVLTVCILVGLLIAGLLIWGRPRGAHRGRDRSADLFGGAQARSAAELRADAAAFAARGEWDHAIVVRFRALARALAERTIVDPAPGATVHGFARDAARAFPGEAASLDAAAAAFDDVRYLRRPGTAELYAHVATLDERLAAASPAVLPDLAGSPR